MKRTPFDSLRAGIKMQRHINRRHPAARRGVLRGAWRLRKSGWLARHSTRRDCGCTYRGGKNTGVCAEHLGAFIEEMKDR